jgi:hypothetical protein
LWGKVERLLDDKSRGEGKGITGHKTGKIAGEEADRNID